MRAVIMISGGRDHLKQQSQSCRSPRSRKANPSNDKGNPSKILRTPVLTLVCREEELLRSEGKRSETMELQCSILRCKGAKEKLRRRLTLRRRKPILTIRESTLSIPTSNELSLLQMEGRLTITRKWNLSRSLMVLTLPLTTSRIIGSIT